jgi:hypothetical protein
MDKTIIAHDLIARCLDGAIPLAIGMFGLIYYPRRISREIESGKLTRLQGAKNLKKVKAIACFAILFGIYLIVAAFFK